MSDDQDMKPTSAEPEVKEKPTDSEEKAEKQEKKEPKKPKSPRKKADAPAPPRTDRPQRERKAVDHYEPPTESSERQALEIEEGSGTALGDIPNVEKRLSATKAGEPEVKKLHAVLFPGAGKGNATKEVVKKHIRAFSGFPGSPSERQSLADAAKKKLESYDRAVLKHIAGILDVSGTGTRTEVAERISEFLMKPKASGHAYQAKARSSSSKGSKKGTKRKSSEKKSGTKRTTNSYMLWRADHYAEFKDKYPDLKITELASKMGEKWRALSADKKKKYEDKAAKLKAEAGSASEAESDDEDSPKKKKKKTSTKKSPSKKKSPAKKKAPAKKKSSKKSESEADESEEDKEESESEEESEEDKKIKLELTLAIEDLLKNADLTALSLKKVREQLQANKAFEKIVDEKKDLIKQLVTAAVQERTAKDKKKEDDKEMNDDA